MLLVWISGCAHREPPILEPLLAREQRVPLVVIPGLTGTRLEDPETGRLVWGRARNAFFPRDGGASLALPVEPSGASENDLLPTEPVWEVRLFGIFRFDAYGSVKRLMQANGYRPGDLRDPDPDGTLFFFAYDWRRDTTSNAARLARQLERLRQARGDESLRVDVLCQSGGCRIARYLIKYGAAPLERAEAGTARPPEKIEVNKLVLVGSANGGSLRVLRELNRGRRYVPILGRRFRPEMLFCMPSLYEGLPGYTDDLFLSPDGDPIEVDLFDPDSWRAYDWSIYREKVAKRIERQGPDELLADAGARERYIESVLNHARGLQTVLGRDVEGFPDTRYYIVQSTDSETPARAVLLQKADGQWETVFPDQKPIRNDETLLGLTIAPGDGHATAESQIALSPQERAALVGEPVEIHDTHRHMLLNPVAQRGILGFLLDESPTETDAGTSGPSDPRASP